ncbi:MAG TPA: cyclic nucleotide-binding domain-containing protein [Candidatus Methylacidiphilales bacterium]|nr:cyclic nucleotide-binding domain-containing protein [Candidatus Methylacidiphilales bacterium]
MEHDFEANFFTLHSLLDMGSRLEIDAACAKVSYEADQIIYRQGEESNAMFIVVAGVVEALTHSPDGKQTRSLAYMKKGDFFGDLGVLTAQPRFATVRACEPTQLLQIEKLMFIRLLDKVPKFGAYFARNLARRLHKTSSEAQLDTYLLDLGGNLQHFNLLIIFQAITSICRSGELRLNNASNDLIGSFFFHEGRVQFARFMHLEGVEAVWQGFIDSTTEGAFSFRVVEKPTLPFNETHKIEFDSTDLLIQGVSKRDEYLAIDETWRNMKGRLHRKTEMLQWTNEVFAPFAPLATRIWDLISKRPQPLDSLWRRLNYSSLAFLQVAGELVRSGQAECILDAPAEPQPESPTEPNPAEPTT